MSGVSNKPMHPYMKEICDRLECGNLTELATRLELPLATLRSYAYYGRIPGYSLSAYKLAETVGITLPELISNFSRPYSKAC